MGPTDQPRLRPDLVVEEVDGEAVVLDPRGDRLHRLNAIATEVVRHCDGSGRVSAIIDRVAGRRGSDRPALDDEVREVLHALAELELLVVDTPTGRS